MHESVYRFASLVLSENLVRDRQVLDVGSLDENGSLRPLVESRGGRYLGVDMRDGNNVDVVMSAEELLGSRFEDAFDVVVSTEMLEHAENWPLALHGVKCAAKVNGTVVVTTRSPGFPRHEYPNDFWRFDKSHIHIAMYGFETTVLMDDPDAPGVFYAGIRARRDCDVPLARTQVHGAPDE